jgi:hypothetical protein
LSNQKHFRFRFLSHLECLPNKGLRKALGLIPIIKNKQTKKTPKNKQQNTINSVCVCARARIFGGTEVELRAACLLGRDTTLWAALPALFVLFIFEIGCSYVLCSCWPALEPPICASLPRWDDRHALPHPALGWDGVSQTFFTRMAWNHNIPTLYLWVARIRGLSHHAQLYLNV